MSSAGQVGGTIMVRHGYTTAYTEGHPVQWEAESMLLLLAKKQLTVDSLPCLVPGKVDMGLTWRRSRGDGSS